MAIAAGVTFLALASSSAGAGDTAALVFSPGAHTPDMLMAVRKLDAGLLQAGGAANVLIVRLTRPVGVGEFMRNGILLALDSSIAAGCSPRLDTSPALSSQADSL